MYANFNTTDIDYRVHIDGILQIIIFITIKVYVVDIIATFWSTIIISLVFIYFLLQYLHFYFSELISKVIFEIDYLFNFQYCIDNSICST
jgi:hypothetical protein